MDRRLPRPGFIIIVALVHLLVLARQASLQQNRRSASSSSTVGPHTALHQFETAARNRVPRITFETKK
ncbi:unnamed protein product [Linum trigynum]|uniref:Secreted protein n=1 Tax=Linum trigynum TaxID=586398 RepID=A0AAV2DJ88_9ROSI